MTEIIFLPDVKKFIKYINKLRKDHNINETHLADITSLDRSSISRMIGKRKEPKARSKEIDYEEASILLNAIMKMISPFPKNTVKKIKTGNKKVKKTGTVKLKDKVSFAAETMVKRGYTQLLVKDDNEQYIGLITDYSLLTRMLHPQEKSKEWLKKFREQTIEKSELVEEVTIFPKNDANPMEIAQALTYHYAVLIDEGKGNYGMITRNNFVKVLMESFPLTG